MQTDYRKLVLFIKAYYEWMEQQGNPGYVLSKLDTIWDSDRSLDEFYSHFKNTYLVSFPELLAINAGGKSPNKNLLLKKIRDFYGNKGTESAYKFLFRLLYDSDLEFYYPKNDILKASDGVWVEPRSVKTTSTNRSALFNGKNGQLLQYNGSSLVASAFIDSVVQYSFNGLPVTEFFITNISGDFQPNAEVKIQKDSSEWSEVAYSVLGDFFVELPGSGYRVGDSVNVVSDGIGFSAQVEQTGLAGSIKRIGIVNSGFNYSGDVVVNIFSDTGAQSAIVVAKKTAVTNYPGYFSGNRGKLSSNKKIQDGHYYQEFSYELKSEVSIDTYFSVLKSIIHPAGMRMFGSILVKKSLDNTITSSDQATFFEVPIVGRYTPYQFGTTLDLRNNGITASGYWLGATGDLYPLGYNPYIGSTTEVGPNGKTTSVGTVFVGTSMGYTYCYVPEGGITSHNPIGAPLGSTSAWYREKENSWTPQGMAGLVLWLKPENIGVCGSVVNGASADVWRDASPSRNDAMPPTWDKWNGIFTSTLRSGEAQGTWTRQVYTTNPITRLQWVFNGLCGGFTTDRLMAIGLNSDPTTNASIATIDYSFYSYGPYGSGNQLTASRRILYSENNSAADISNVGTNYTAFDNTIFEIEYVEPNIIYRMNGVVRRRVFAGFNRTFYMDSSFHNTTPYTARNGHCFTVLGMWNGINPVVPTASTVISTSGITSIVYAGLTVDKLRPTLQTAGYGGATGISFNGGLVFSPASVFAGISLSTGICMGFTAAGSTAEKLMTGQHLYLNYPLVVRDDADVFVVYKSTIEGTSYGYGILASRNTNNIYQPTVFDTVLYHRSYNVQDRSPSLQTSVNYSVLPNGTLMYPSGASLMPAGLVGFRPQGGQAGAVQNTIAYDPHVSGVCFGICVGELRRDSSNRIESFLNGDGALNLSRSTGRRMISVSAPNTEQYAITKNLVFHFDMGQAATRAEYVFAKNADLLDAYPFRETPINVLAPQTPNMFRGDVGGDVLNPVRVTQDGGPALSTEEIYEFTTASNGNVYLQQSLPGVWADSTLESTTWTFTATIRRDDGAAITSAGVYIYTDDTVENAAPGTIQSIGSGWYKITRTKTGSSSTVTLVGLYGLGAGVKYRIGRVQLLPYPSDSDIAGTTTRTSSSYPPNYGLYGTPNANEIGYKTGPFSKSQIVWHGRNHSTINNIASFNSNVGFNTPSVAIDRTKLYRYSVWVNRAVLGNDGNVYFGENGGFVLKRSDGTTDSNPYFTTDGPNGDAYTGKENQWVLVVGHIHPVGSGSGSNHPNSGFYLPNSGTTYAPLRGNGSDVNYSDKVWSSTSSTSSLRVFLYGSSDTSTQVQFLQPRIEIVDGSEISIEDLTSNRINTLYDLSSTGTQCEVFNGTQYSSDVGGEIAFNNGPGVITSKDGLALGTSGNSTWEAWIKPSVATSTLASMYMGAGLTPFFSAPTDSSQRIAWATLIGGTRQTLYSPVGTVVANQWIHVACVAAYDGTQTEMKMYINGVLRSSSKFDGIQTYVDINNDPTETPLISIGNRYHGVRWSGDGSGADYGFRGSVSNVRVYSRAISDQEVLQNYNSLRSRFSL